MTVTVVDRELERAMWGHGYRTIFQVIKTIEISDKCPKCGGPRGEPHLQRYHDDGDWYYVSRWDNPCGHTDYYGDVLKEAAAAEGGAR